MSLERTPDEDRCSRERSWWRREIRRHDTDQHGGGEGHRERHCGAEGPNLADLFHIAEKRTRSCVSRFSPRLALRPDKTRRTGGCHLTRREENPTRRRPWGAAFVMESFRRVPYSPPHVGDARRRLLQGVRWVGASLAPSEART